MLRGVRQGVRQCVNLNRPSPNNLADTVTTNMVLQQQHIHISRWLGPPHSGQPLLLSLGMRQEWHPQN